MAALRSLGGYRARVRVVMALLAINLLVLAGIHGLSLLRAHRRLETELFARTRTAADAVITTVGLDQLRTLLGAWRTHGSAPPRLPISQQFLLVNGLVAVDLLTAEGWRMDPDPKATSRPRTLTAEERQRLSEGVPVIDSRPDRFGAVQAATIRLYHPILDWDSTLLGVISAEASAEVLAESRQDVRRSFLLQGGSLLGFLLLMLLFTRWMLRPVELLALSARTGDAATAEALAARDETGFVIETYRRLVEQLQEKEQELRRLREVERHRADDLEQLNSSIVDSMVSGVIVVDLSGRIRSVNEAARETLRLDESRVVGRQHADALAHVPELAQRIAACLEDGTVVRRDELRLGLAGVGRRDLGLSVSPLRGHEGERNGALCLVTDLTEVKRLQEQVRLKESLADLGELSAGIAHEFRNALATILGFASLIERTGEGDAREHAAAIHAESTALRAVVDDFLRFANPTRLVVEPMDLRQVVQDAAGDAGRRAAGGGPALDISGPALPITGDETLLRRVFTNLLRNAVEAAGVEGHVQATIVPGDGHVRVHVDDDGPGVAPEDRDHLFVPFFTRKASGTGLGLALARKVVVHHGGTLELDSSPSGGARFTVTLPLRSE